MSTTETGLGGEIVYQLDVTDDWHHELPPTHREMVNVWIEAHGIDRNAALLPNAVKVRLQDGRLWFEGWRAVGNDARTAPLCESCPACIKQEEVSTPLIAPVPPFGHVYKTAREKGIVPVADVPGVGSAELAELLTAAREREAGRQRAATAALARLSQAVADARAREVVQPTATSQF